MSSDNTVSLNMSGSYFYYDDVSSTIIQLQFNPVGYIWTLLDKGMKYKMAVGHQQIKRFVSSFIPICHKCIQGPFFFNIYEARNTQ